MEYMKHNDQIRMLLSALSSAITYDDKDAAIALIHTGMAWAKAENDTDQDNAWHQVTIAAKWVSNDN